MDEVADQRKTDKMSQPNGSPQQSANQRMPYRLKHVNADEELLNALEKIGLQTMSGKNERIFDRRTCNLAYFFYKKGKINKK